MKIFIINLIFCCLLSSCFQNLASTEQKSESDIFVNTVQAWSNKSGIGLLETKQIGSNNIELRVWGGFGRLGNYGAIIERKNGQWKGYTIDIQYYRVGATEALARERGLLSPCLIQSMSDRCIVEASSSSYNKIEEYSLECPYVELTNNDNTNYVDLWEQLVELGILTLPKIIEPSYISKNINGRKVITVIADGHHYVVELKIGNQYRVSNISHIEYLESQVEIGKNVELMASKLDDFLGSNLTINERF